MSNKSNQIAPVHRVGLIYTAPSAPTTTVSVYKDTHDGTKTTSRYMEMQKAGDFVDRRSGNTGYREEARFQQTHRVNDKARGFTKEIQTEVKVRETTTFHNNNNYYHGGGSGGGYGYNNGGGYNYDSHNDYYDDSHNDYYDDEIDDDYY